MAGLQKQHGDLLARLRQFQQEGLFCDLRVTLKDGQEIPAMTPLLAGISPVFEAMLTTDMIEMRTSELKLPEVSAEVWKCVMGFYCSSEKLVTKRNVCEVVNICEMYQLEEMKKYCDNTLFTCCRPENCISLQMIARKFSLPISTTEIAKYIADHFTEVLKSHDFSSVEEDDLLEMLDDSAMKVYEDDVCKGVLNWLKANQSSPETAIKVFSKLRLWKISSEFLAQQVMYDGIVMSNDVIKNAVKNEVQARLAIEPFIKPAGPKPPRRGLPTPPMNLMVLGSDGKSTHFYACSYNSRQWKALPSPPRKSRAAAAFVENCLIVTGGQEESYRTHIFDKKNKKTEWREGPNLHYGRYDHGMVGLGGSAYVVGGSCYSYSSSRNIKNVEALKKNGTRWESWGELNHGVTECCLSTMGDRTILVTGNGSESSVSLLIQSFDVVSKTACVLDTKLSRSISPARGVSLGDLVCFVGSNGDLVKVRHSGGKLQVTEHIQLPEYGSRSHCGVHYSNGHIWVFGGAGSNYGKSVRCYSLSGKEGDSSSVLCLPTRMTVLAVRGDSKDVTVSSRD